MQRSSTDPTGAIDWVPRDGIPWVCPECWAILGPATVQRSVALRKLHEHLAAGHKNRHEIGYEEEEGPDEIGFDVPDDESRDTDRTHLSEQKAEKRRSVFDLPLLRTRTIPPAKAAPPNPTQMGASPRYRKLIKCPHCPSSVREDRLQFHINRLHHMPAGTGQRSVPVPRPTPGPQVQPVFVAPSDIPVERFSFELLPPSTWEIDDVMRHYRAQAHNHPELFYGRAIDYGRIEKLKSLQPVKCYIGQELWNGYVVFEFRGSARVVMDCPVEGNALYVLSGDWKRMVARSKAYLRANYSSSYTKIVHKGDWLDRVRYALEAAANKRSSVR